MRECPDDLQLALFAENSLTDAESHQVAAHARECPECRHVWTAVTELQGEVAAGVLPSLTEGERAAALRVIRKAAEPQSTDGSLARLAPLSAFFAGLVEAREVAETVLASPLLAGEAGLLPRAARPDNMAMHLCALRCEAAILRASGLEVNEERLVAVAAGQGWFVPGGGTPMAHLGKLLQAHGMVVERYYHAHVDVLRHAIGAGYSVMVAVDGGELLKRGRLARWLERMEDFVARIPDHCVLVTGVHGGDTACEVTVIDPVSSEHGITVSADTFYDAWEDSNFFMLAARMAHENA